MAACSRYCSIGRTGACLRRLFPAAFSRCWRPGALARFSRAGGVLPLILAGVVISAFFTAVHGLIQTTADPENKLPAMVYWLIGSFAGANPHKLAILAPPVLFAGGALLLLRWRINLLSLDDMDAAALGQRVAGLRWIVVALVALIVAAQVSVSGIVGWVGLIVPHFARMFVGPDHRRLLPASALTGAIFLLLTDDIGRTLAPQELPIGILTAGSARRFSPCCSGGCKQGDGAMNESAICFAGSRPRLSSRDAGFSAIMRRGWTAAEYWLCSGPTGAARRLCCGCCSAR